ncbi:hypothetical protein GCM10012287_56610 [Streptomyces daqingensis]|uniref:Uncharacterized protein n=1 Tax=Streptomyces daqingensis TaxID=1472640 RepID=A0ABQ2MTC6_9ACTN|nr:hypothetical protein GCM10012287_56610 [Streptomyces daqingensis]
MASLPHAFRPCADRFAATTVTAAAAAIRLGGAAAAPSDSTFARAVEHRAGGVPDPGSLPLRRGI